MVCEADDNDTVEEWEVTTAADNAADLVYRIVGGVSSTPHGHARRGRGSGDRRGGVGWPSLMGWPALAHTPSLMRSNVGLRFTARRSPPLALVPPVSAPQSADEMSMQDTAMLAGDMAAAAAKQAGATGALVGELAGAAAGDICIQVGVRQCAAREIGVVVCTRVPQEERGMCGSRCVCVVVRAASIAPSDSHMGRRFPDRIAWLHGCVLFARDR